MMRAQLKRFTVNVFLICAIFYAAFARADTVFGVDAIGITVTDMDRSLVFYTRVLPFKVISDRQVMGSDYEHLFGVFGLRTRIVRLALGDEYIELIDYIAKQGRPIPADSQSNDEWFQHIAIIVSDMDRAYAHLQKHRVTHASPAPQRLPDWNPNAGGIKAFYFRDPDGNHLEILEFPPGKGDPRWHQNNEQLFLGIDHTAIVVQDTETALQFYRDGLGLKVKGQSENYGIEQERLNNVFGARLRITSLAGNFGPAIEFLEYLAPRTGRSMPDDTRANDLWHWQIHFLTDSVENVVSRITTNGGSLVSPDIINMTGDAPFDAGVLARGPTGHAMMVFSKESSRAIGQQPKGKQYE